MYNLKIAIRNLRRNRFYSVINVVGLSIGMAAAILLLVWIYNEWSYDRFHTKEKQLYVVYNRAKVDGEIWCWNWTPAIMAPTLKADYPEIAEVTRVSSGSKFLFTIGDKKLYVQPAFIDPGFLSMFDFPLLHGDKSTALNDARSIILTEKTAKRLFGNEDPMGKTIISEAKYPFTVSGVMKDLPSNTTFDFEALIPMAFRKSEGWLSEEWGNNSLQTYIELQPQVQAESVNKLISDITKKHMNNGEEIDVFIYPLSEQHLYSKFENGVPVGGRIDSLRIFVLVAVLILLIACINFMNLSTARSEKRAREVGVRKVMGARQKSLIGQFLGESAVIAFIAGLIAIFLAKLILPVYSTLMGKTLVLDLTNGWFWLAGVVFILFTALLAGSYPAFYLSSFLPVKVLKGTFKGERTLVAPRKILVIVQFTFAVFLIISTLIINRQIRYAQERDNGYNKEQLIYHTITEDIGKNFDLIKHDLLSSGTAVSVTKTMAPMTEGWSNTWGFEWKGKNPDDRSIVDRYFVDADWTKTVGTKIVQGRDIDVYTYPTDSSAVLLNESAVKLMNFDNPVGETIRDGGIEWHVVGVVKDFILHSPYEATVPMVIGGPKGWFNVMHIRLNGANEMSDNLAKAEQIFRKYNPAYPFDYKFVDKEYSKKFQEEKTMNSLATWFAVLAVFISCLGLFALVAYMAETRTKEIGIRKVLGASIQDIVSLLSREFMILVLISIFIAAPIAWWSMNKWLKSYVYHTDIPWWIFVIVGLMSLLIALLTVSFQAVKAATANPVKSIKTE